MMRVNLADLPWVEWGSPRGSFAGAGQQVSEALAAQDPGAAGGLIHPFDLEIGKLAPGKSGCPFHSHASQWELFVIENGSGEVRYGNHRRAVSAGDAVMHPPGEAHQLINTGDEELRYLLVADNPAVDWYYYPDSRKWGIKGQGVFRRQDVHFYLDEEAGAPPVASRPEPEQPEPPLARFARLDALPWETKASPGGRYGSSCCDLSLALGGRRNCDTARGGHPFDLQLRRVPAGKAICPFHSHSAQWELFLVRSGRARIRSGAETVELAAGELILHPPGTPHQTLSLGPDELEVLIIADNQAYDACHYPDSDKRGTRDLGAYRIQPVDYFHGEE